MLTEIDPIRTSRYRLATAVLLPMLLMAPGLPGQEVTLAVVLERLQQYLRGYAELLPATVAVERYEQSSGAGEHVQLESEFGIVRVPDNPQWLGFRDVMKVNGHALEGHERRLSALFEKPNANAIAQARRIALESARYNIGPVARTINDPALVLELLDARNAHRMRFEKDREDAQTGMPAWVVRFVETGRPTIVRTSSARDVPASGRAWVDPATGRLLRVQAAIDSLPSLRRIRCDVDVTFQKTSALDFWTPATMTERCSDGGSTQRGEATYDSYRQFSVDTRESIGTVR